MGVVIYLPCIRSNNINNQPLWLSKKEKKVLKHFTKKANRSPGEGLQPMMMHLTLYPMIFDGYPSKKIEELLKVQKPERHIISCSNVFTNKTARHWTILSN